MTKYQYLRLLLTQYVLELEGGKDDGEHFAELFKAHTGVDLLVGFVFDWRNAMNNNKIYSQIGPDSEIDNSW